VGAGAQGGKFFFVELADPDSGKFDGRGVEGVVAGGDELAVVACEYDATGE